MHNTVAGHTQEGYHKCDPRPQWTGTQCPDWKICLISHRRNQFPVHSHTHFLHHTHVQNLQALQQPYTGHLKYTWLNGWLQGCSAAQPLTWINSASPKSGRFCPGFQWQRSHHQDAMMMQMNNQSAQIREQLSARQTKNCITISSLGIQRAQILSS